MELIEFPQFIIVIHLRSFGRFLLKIRQSFQKLFQQYLRNVLELNVLDVEEIC